MEFSGYTNIEKVKFDKVGGYQNEENPLKQGRQNSNFNHLRWTHEIFRIGKYEGKLKFDRIWKFYNGLSLSNFLTI